jgi:hypothetical protein
MMYKFVKCISMYLTIYLCTYVGLFNSIIYKFIKCGCNDLFESRCFNLSTFNEFVSNIQEGIYLSKHLSI